MESLLLNSDFDNNNLLIYYMLHNERKNFKTKNFDFRKIDEKTCKEMFRFEKEDILRLKRALRIPDEMKTAYQNSFTGIEGICILLKRLTYPNRLFDMTTHFPRSKSELSNIITTMVDYIYNNYSYLLNDVDHWWLDHVHLTIYSNAVRNKGAPLENCFGFVDGTLRPICRPGKNQQEVYNGHKRVHGLKFQSVVIPNGLIANLYGPVSGRRHDSYMLTQSNLLEKLNQINQTAPLNENFCLYGDPAYPLRQHLIGPYRSNLTPEKSAFNTRMSSVRETVEWEFSKMVQLFAFLDFKKNLKLYLQPVGKLYIVGAILKNCHACLYNCQTNLYFGTETPEIEAYLNYNENNINDE